MKLMVLNFIMIKLRKLQKNDKTKLRVWRNSSEISKYMYSEHKISSEEHDLWFDNVIRKQSDYYWMIVCDNEDVGLVNLYDIDLKNSRCFWAFYLASHNIRGKGVGSFVEYTILNHVFYTLGLNKLCCEVLDFNASVVEMHKKFGFVQEGFFNEHITKSNKRYDVFRLAILKEDWRNIQSTISDKLTKKGILNENQ